MGYNSNIETPEFQATLRRFFNEGGIVEVTNEQYKYILGHFHTPQEDIYIIREREDNKKVIQLW